MKFRFFCYLFITFSLLMSSGSRAEEQDDLALVPVINFLLNNTAQDVSDDNAGEGEVFETIPAIPSDFEGKYYLTIKTDFDSQFSSDQEYVYTQLNSNVEIVERFSDTIRISVDGGGLVGADRLLRTEDFTWEMSSPRNGPEAGRLMEGVVDGIQTSPTFDDTAHRLRVSGNGSSCSPRSGSFRIFDVEYTDGIITKLVSDFEFNCFGRQMTGSIDFDDSRADAVLPDVVIPELPTFPALPELDARGAVLVINGSDDTPIIRSEGLFLNSSNSTFTISPTFGSTTGVSMVFRDDQNDTYNLEFRRSELAIDPLLDEPLSVGVYAPVTRSAFSAPLAGLSFSGAGRGCNNSGGRFSVYEIELNEANEFVKLVADFEMFCSIDDEPLRGSVRVDLTLPE